jgi:FkbM family methyltransferase
MKQTFKSILGQKNVQFLRKIKSHFFPTPTEEPKLTGEDLALFNQRKAFYKSFINAKDLVFDVGANIGNRVNPLLNIGARVVAIEPQEECVKILNRKFGDQIKIVPVGLGEKEELKDFFVSDANVISSFSSEWIDSVKNTRFKDYSWEKSIKIQVTTLNKLIEQYGLPKFIKIDVEGFELEVLKGLSLAVDMISFEYTVPEQIQKAIDCINQIEKHNPSIECNYAIGEITEFALEKWQSPAEFKKYIAGEEFIGTDFGDIYIRKLPEI